MKHRILIIFFLSLMILPLLSNGQRWKRTRYEILGGIGLTAMFGDLGGANSDAIYAMDYDIRSSRVAGNIGVRYKFREEIAMKISLMPGLLYGSDAFTSMQRRAGRELKTNTFFFETGLQLEYSLIKEKLSTRYTFRNLRDFRLRNINTYIFIGVSNVFFSPKITKAGVPYSTGMGYSKTTLAVPLGVGFKYGINRRYAMGIEFGYRKTFSDFIDGYSSKWSKSKDLYVVFLINVSYKLKTSKSGLPRF